MCASAPSVESVRARAERLAAGLIGCACLAPRTAAAQVNVEPLRQQVVERGFGARVGGSLTGYAGNTQGVQLATSAFVGGRYASHLIYGAGSASYTRLNEVVSVAKWFGHLRYNYELAQWLYWEIFGQVEGDRFRRVSLRRLIGTGPRLQLISSDDFALTYGTSYLNEASTIASDEGSPGGVRHAQRWNNYVSTELRAHPKITLSNVTYVQPSFSDFSDMHLLSVLAADFEVTPRLHSRFDATLRYENPRPALVKPADLELKSSLELVF